MPPSRQATTLAVAAVCGLLLLVSMGGIAGGPDDDARRLANAGTPPDAVRGSPRGVDEPPAAQYEPTPAAAETTVADSATNRETAAPASPSGGGAATAPVAPSASVQELLAADPHGVFGAIGGWAEAVTSNFVRAAAQQRIVDRVSRQERSAGTAALHGLWSEARRTLMDPANRFCAAVPSGQQPQRDALNLHIERCYSPAATVTVDAPLPAFKMRPGTREIIGVEPLPKRSPGPRVIGCQGVYILRPLDRTRLNVCNASGAAVSHDAAWAAALRRVFGPLHLRLYLEGPEAVTGDVQFDANTCTYYVHFRVNSPGKYNVNLKAQHNDFWGVDETHHRTRHNFNKYLISRSAPPLECRWDGDRIIDSHHRDAAEREGRPERVYDQQELAANAPAKAGKRVKQVRFGPALPHIGVNLRRPPEFAAVDASPMWGSRWVQRPFPHTLFDGRILRASTYQLEPYASGTIGIDAKFAPPFGIAPASGKPLTAAIGPAELAGAPRGDVVDPPQLVWHQRTAVTAALKRLASIRGRVDAKRVGKPLELMVSGDSQSRSVYWALKNYLNTVERYGDDALNAAKEVAAAGGVTKQQQEEDEAARARVAAAKGVALEKEALSFEQRDKKGDKVRTAHSRFLDLGDGSQAPLVLAYYKWDSYLADLAANAARADIIVAGFGSHPASWGQWSFAKFAQRAEGVADVLCEQAVRQRKVVLYYGAPAWPKMKLVDNFRATNQRLAALNGIAAAAIERRCQQILSDAGRAPVDLADPSFPVRLVDFMGMSLPLMKHSKDGSHYDGTVVVSTLAHEMLREVTTAVAALTAVESG